MLSVLLAILSTAAAPQFEVRTLDGQSVVGTIAALDADRVTIATADGQVSLGTDVLAGLYGPEQPRASAPQGDVRIALADGSWLVAREYTVRDGRAEVVFVDGLLVEVPAGGIGSVRLQAQSEAMAAEWSRIIERKTSTDLLVVRRGEAIDYLEGVLHDVTDAVVQFEIGGDVLPVKRSKVHGLIYYHPPKEEAPPSVCRISDITGSQWLAKSVSLEGGLHWTTPAGTKATRDLATITEIDFSHGKIVFLSDLRAESVTFTPYFGTLAGVPSLSKLFAPRSDENFESGPLKLDRTPYSKGLALHSRTLAVYRLPGRFRRFKAIAGIDDAVRPQGNVHLTIRGDDRILLETTLNGTDPPLPVDLDIEGVRRITLLVDFGDQMDMADHLDLCEARIVK